MRHLLLLLAAASLLSACATSEPSGEDAGTTPEPASPVPGWYDDRMSSRSDSLFIEGFAMASALDSARAAELSSESALRNLKLGIDRAVDGVRSDLASDSEQYRSTRFIISLREAVGRMQLDDLDAETAYEQAGNGTHIIYTRYRVQKSRLPELLSASGLDDRSFLERLAGI